MNNKPRYFFDLHQILFNREDCYILLVDLATSKTYDKTDKR